MASSEVARRGIGLAVVLSLGGCVRASPVSPLDQSAAAAALTTLDGRPVNLPALLAGKDATVLSFFSTTCPCVARYQERTEALGLLAPDRLQVLYVSSNANEDRDSLERTHAERGLRLPLLVDWSGALASQLGARSTPTVVLLDRTGAVRFLGWQDNERLVGAPDREPYLERAISALLAEQPGAPTRSPTYGCPITRSLGAGVPACRVPPSPPEASP